MKFSFKNLRKFLERLMFNPKWTCSACGREVFDGGYFCEDCKKKLPYNNKAICEHCGRALNNPSDYCLTCKNTLTSFDKARSVYKYEKPINGLIKKLKYKKGKYLADCFAKDLADLYVKSGFNADFLTFVPMTIRAEKKRGFNQSELLARKVSEFLNVPVFYGIIKKTETKNQTKLKRSDRKKNLENSFRITESVKDKSFVLIDDVTTTGCTAEEIATTFKRKGAAKVFVLTVAGVSGKNPI